MTPLSVVIPTLNAGPTLGATLDAVAGAETVVADGGSVDGTVALAEARRIERLVAWRCRTLALPYGDQGLLISAAFYRTLGGFRALPLMEDVDLVRRIGRRRLAELPVAFTTSAARYRRGGWM